MTVEHVELLVEEPSMEAALRLLLSKILGDLSFEVYAHQCKDELLLRLPERLRGYGRRCKSDAWFRDNCRIVVVVDRDDDGCGHQGFTTTMEFFPPKPSSLPCGLPSSVFHAEPSTRNL